jgi:hypothetical protein
MFFSINFCNNDALCYFIGYTNDFTHSIFMKTLYIFFDCLFIFVVYCILFISSCFCACFCAWQCYCCYKAFVHISIITYVTCCQSSCVVHPALGKKFCGYYSRYVALLFRAFVNVYGDQIWSKYVPTMRVCELIDLSKRKEIFVYRSRGLSSTIIGCPLLFHFAFQYMCSF